MVKSLSIHRRTLFRSTLRLNTRKHVRHLNRSCIRNLPGFRPGLYDLSQALTAFSRAIRAHRRLARLAPEFFDATEVDRLARQRKQDAEWRALWEPALNKIYGSSSDEKPVRDTSADLPQWPKSPRTNRAIEREFASWQFWMSAGKLAMARHRQRRPHAMPSLGRIARLFEIAFAFARLACGSPPSKADLESSGHAQALADLERIYGNHSPPTSSVPAEVKSQASANATDSASNPCVAHSPSASPRSPSVSSTNGCAQVDIKRDFTPCALVIGPHGLLCLQPITQQSHEQLSY